MRMYDPVVQLSPYDRSFSYQVHLSGVVRGSFSLRLKLEDSFAFLGILQGLALSKTKQVTFSILVKLNNKIFKRDTVV